MIWKEYAETGLMRTDRAWQQRNAGVSMTPPEPAFPLLDAEEEVFRWRREQFRHL